MSQESGGCVMSDFNNFNQISYDLDEEISKYITDYTDSYNSTLIADPFMDPIAPKDTLEHNNNMDYSNTTNGVSKSNKRKLVTTVKSSKQSRIQDPNDDLELNAAGSATTGISPNMHHLSMADAEGDIRLVVNNLYGILRQHHSFSPSSIRQLNELLIRTLKEDGVSNVLIENIRTCGNLKCNIVGKSYKIIISCILHQEYHKQLTFLKY